MRAEVMLLSVVLFSEGQWIYYVWYIALPS